MSELGLLVTARVFERHGESHAKLARESHVELAPDLLPADPEGRVEPALCARIDAAYFSGDVFPDGARAFFAAAPGSRTRRPRSRATCAARRSWCSGSARSAARSRAWPARWGST